MTPMLHDAFIPELPNHYRGKTRHTYDLENGRYLIIATDRLSAFDRAICSIPDKGYILTETTRFWFNETADICPNHVLGYPDFNVLVARRLRMIPVEFVVRDYLAGTTSTSILSMYKAGHRNMYGLALPDGLRDYQKLPATTITPTTKSDDHDAPLTLAQIVEQNLLTQADLDLVVGYSLALFARARDLASAAGLIIADTKYEFGFDETGRIVLADEIHTPDSSRYWFADSYEQAVENVEPPPSFDKDIIRHWVTEHCNPYEDLVPEIPESLIERTTAAYVQAYCRMTGGFLWKLPEQPILERIRENLRLVGILAA